MTDAREPEQKKRTGRYVLWGCLAAVISVVLLSGVVFNDFHHYQIDGIECMSDILPYDNIRQYQQEHHGALPEKVEDIPNLDRWPPLVCYGANAKLIWRPKGIHTDDGGPVLMMCPPDAHGWIRQFSMGLAVDKGEVAIVRIRNGRVIESH